MSNLPRGLVLKLTPKFLKMVIPKKINKRKIIYNNCESHKMGSTKIPSECLLHERCLLHEISGGMLPSSWHNLVLVLSKRAVSIIWNLNLIPILPKA